ncbi:prefoldin subunit beta [Candidatus Pacearchaeota archaeon]|nr:prefoldin subunit beta [Candidatus Pacearchaeota archaeon]
MDAVARQKIQDLQILEQNLQNILIQKQNLQADLNETVNALEEVKKTTDAIYKMVGSIMVVVDKKKTLEELEEKKKLSELRNDSISKQERLIESKARELQQEIKKLLENKSPSTSK